MTHRPDEVRNWLLETPEQLPATLSRIDCGGALTMMNTKTTSVAVALGASLLALTGCRSDSDDQKGPASPRATAATSETPKYTAEEQAFLQQVRAADNFVAADDEDALIAAAHVWCDNRVPGASPTNATLSAQIESKYPIVGSLGSFPGWQPTATTTICPEMER